MPTSGPIWSTRQVTSRATRTAAIFDGQHPGCEPTHGPHGRRIGGAEPQPRPILAVEPEALAEHDPRGMSKRDEEALTALRGLAARHGLDLGEARVGRHAVRA